MTYVTVSVDVDICLSDIDTKDLEAALASRSKSVNPLPGEEQSGLAEIYYALKFGLNDKALDLMRAHVCDQLGCVL